MSEDIYLDSNGEKIDDDLFKEPKDDVEESQDDTQNGSDFDAMACGLAEFYWGLRDRKISRWQAFKLTESFMEYMLNITRR